MPPSFEQAIQCGRVSKSLCKTWAHIHTTTRKQPLQSCTAFFNQNRVVIILWFPQTNSPNFAILPAFVRETSTQSPGFHRSQPLALGWRWQHLGGHVFVELDGGFHNLSAWCADLMCLSMLICLSVNKQDMYIYICTYNMRNYMVM